MFEICFHKIFLKYLIDMSSDWSGGFLISAFGQVHQVHFYTKRVSAIFHLTSKFIVIFEFIVISGNVNSCFNELMLLYH